MKKGVFICLIISLMTNLFAQDNKSIVLNPPSRDRGKTVIDALWQRSSPREFDTKKISDQDLSDLLWPQMELIAQRRVRELHPQP